MQFYKKLLTLVSALWCSAFFFAAGQTSKFDAIRGGFSGKKTSLDISPQTIVISILGVVVIILILTARARQKALLEKVRQSHALFQSTMKKYAFSPEQTALLEEICDITQQQFPGDFLRKRPVWESAVSNYLFRKTQKEDAQRMSGHYVKIAEIRKKIGYDKPDSNFNIVSTKELSAGSTIGLHCEKKKYSMSIANNTEEALFLQAPWAVKIDSLKPGTPAQISFYFEKSGHYRAATRLLRLVPASGQIVVQHTYRLGKPKKRKAIRFTCMIKCTFQVNGKAMTASGSPYTGEITNISDGGMQLEVYTDIPLTSQVSVSFNVNDKIFFSSLPLQMVSRASVGNKYVCHTCFASIGPEDQTKINKALREVERTRKLLHKR